MLHCNRKAAEPGTAPRANPRMNGPLEWIAALGTMLAAGLVAADLGRKATGWGFVLFCAVAAAWVVAGMTTHAVPIAAMNAILLLINGWGVWQDLLNRRKKKVIDRVEQVTEQIEREAAAEDAG